MKNRVASIKKVVIVASGNFLEMYDFMVFGYFAPYIATTFFPAQNEYLSLLLTLMTFGAGFIMRPVGAVVLGAYVDRHGRRKGLLLTLALMAVGTIAIATCPGYETLGVVAPLIVLCGRLIQGLSAGVELGGVSVYLAEIAPPGRRGFYVAWQSASQQVAVVLASLAGFAANTWLTPVEMSDWGWRIPFFVGCALVPFLLLARRYLEETDEFLLRSPRPTMRESVRSVAANWRVVIGGMLLATMTTVFFYMITAYTPTYGSKVLHLSSQDSLLVSMLVGVLNFTLLPIMGSLSDRTGRLPLLIICSATALICGYPLLSWLVQAPSFNRFLITQLSFALIYASYNGAMIVFLTEIMPPAVRISGFSLAYSLATALFGGFTPALSTYLIEVTGNRAAPGVWLSIAAGCGLLAAAMFYRQQKSYRIGSKFSSAGVL